MTSSAGGKERTARCSCGALRAIMTGAPARVIACHCTECQRRTGAPLGVIAYVPRNQVRIEGESTAFVRPAAEGRSFTRHFCPRCGCTVWVDADIAPDMIGIPVGGFADPSFPP